MSSRLCKFAARLTWIVDVSPVAVGIWPRSFRLSRRVGAGFHRWVAQSDVAGAPDAVLAAGPAAVTQFEVGEMTARAWHAERLEQQGQPPSPRDVACEPVLLRITRPSPELTTGRRATGDPKSRAG